MADQLSPQAEQFIATALAHGQFASRDALLDAAVAVLQAQEDEPLRLVDEAIDEADAGATADWDLADMKRRLHQRLHKTA